MPVHLNVQKQEKSENEFEFVATVRVCNGEGTRDFFISESKNGDKQEAIKNAKDKAKLLFTTYAQELDEL